MDIIIGCDFQRVTNNFCTHFPDSILDQNDLVRGTRKQSSLSSLSENACETFLTKEFQTNFMNYPKQTTLPRIVAPATCNDVFKFPDDTTLRTRALL